MRKLFLGVGLLLFSLLVLILSEQTAFASTAGPVIYQLQTQGNSSASTEYVSVKNDGASEVDVSNWCVVYSSSSDITQTTLKCLSPPDANTKIWLPANAYFSFATNEFLTTTPSYIPDGIFNAGMAATSGHIKLIDANKNVIDKLGWGSALSPETAAKPAHSSGTILQRMGSDTDNNLADFTQTTLSSIPPSGLYEEVILVDECPNIPGLDVAVPAGYMKDGDGNCYEDICDNVSGLQKILPTGYYQEGIDCEIIRLKLTELLPNASGSDDGKEFIEIYNPTNYQVDLDGFLLQIGPSYSKNFALPAFILNPRDFISFSDAQTTITLPNTSASVKLLTPDGQAVDETFMYQDPKDDQAWALFDDSWQYTNQPTASKINLKSIDIETSTNSDEPTPCPEGKYRNPETNRCKAIEAESGLKPCAADQVRNTETNRCRSIFASDSGLTLCKPGQTRSPETNRCRNSATLASALKPCSPKQERNIETNRCRNKTTSAIAASEIKDVESEIKADQGGWLLAGTAGVGLAGYGVAEWRTEISSGLRRFKSLLGKNPPDL